MTATLAQLEQLVANKSLMPQQTARAQLFLDFVKKIGSTPVVPAPAPPQPPVSDLPIPA